VAAVEQDIEARLRAALNDALRTRDVVAAFAVRSALAAIGNAEAVPAETVPAGTTEVARRVLGPAETRRIVEAEIGERESAAGQYEQNGHGDRAGTLRREAQILRDVLAG
jgi:uncharacterized protein